MSRSRTILKAIPGIYPLYRLTKRVYNAALSSSSPFVQTYPAGHFYSPLPSAEDVRSRQDILFKRADKSFPGIDMREQAQLALLRELARYYDELPFPEEPVPGKRYYYRNDFYCYGDAVVLYALLRHVKPRRVVEVGSGFSSAVMLDTNELFLDGRVDFTFIEPYPQRLLSLLRQEDEQNSRIITRPVQEVDTDVFTRLEANDVLLVDSSHVVKIGSDVVRLVFDILPLLKPGVYVHFHDVFWPFEYPEEWLRSGVAWNEAYFVRAFLQYNTAYEVVYFNSFMAEYHRKEIERLMPITLKNPGASLWIRRVA